MTPEPDSSPTLHPPDISAFRAGNTGVDYVTSFDSGIDGPHLLINGLTHGNELCGAVAIEFLFRLGIRPARGRLTLVLANVAAFQAFDPARPYLSRYIDEDFNRLWSIAALEGAGDNVERQRARQLRPIYERADVLLDLHSMQNPTAPLILCGRTRRGQALAQRLGFPSWIICDSGHVAGPRLIDYQRFAEPAGSPAAVLVECGQHWQQPAAEVAIETALRFLLIHGQIEPDRAAPYLKHPPPPQRMVDVTHAVTAHTDEFVFADDFVGMEILPDAGTLIGHDGDREVRTPYDQCLLIMPSRRLRKGQTAVRFGRITEL